MRGLFCCLARPAGPSGGTRLFAACSISGALSIDMNILDKGGNHHGYFWF